MNDLLTAGEFASLARTTKRTIIWYDKKGILKPFQVNEKGYRYYKHAQIIDFQVISLLRQLDFSIRDIREFLKDSKSLKSLFKKQKDAIESELKQMKLRLDSIEDYYENLDKKGLLVKPRLKKIKPYTIVYIKREGAYANIKNYCLELKEMLGEIALGRELFLTIFEENSYQPKKARMKIGVMFNKKKEVVKQQLGKVSSEINIEKVESYTSLVHIHKGSGRFNSLLWKQLYLYMKRAKFKRHHKIQHREIYHKTSLNGYESEDEHVFELQRPIASSTVV